MLLATIRVRTVASFRPAAAPATVITDPATIIDRATTVGLETTIDRGAMVALATTTPASVRTRIIMATDQDKTTGVPQRCRQTAEIGPARTLAREVPQAALIALQ